MRKQGETMKRYTIEKLDIAAAILGIILMVIDAIKGIPYIKIWLGISLYFALFFNCICLIVKWLCSIIF